MALISINPATGQRIAVYRTLTRAELERRVAAATTAQRRWRDVPIAERAARVRELAAVVRARRDALAALATEEMGKPITQARGEADKCAALCDYYAERGEALLEDQRPVGAPANARVAFAPLGVVLAIMPWNFPYWQVFRAAVPALLAGNAVLLKHAPSVPGCALALERLFSRAGFPRGLFTSLPIDTRPVPGLIADPRIAGVTLTGSTRAGREVGQLAGAALKPTVFELGGSDPLLVLEDADLERAAAVAVEARLINSGQSCVCAKRFIVVRPVAAAFRDKFVAALAAARVGDPTEPRTAVGPLARADLRDALHAQVRRSVHQGARLLTGGAPLPGPGFFYAPTVLDAVTPGTVAFDEELFGPVAALITARDERHAVALANASRYGLAATVFTADADRARRIVAQLDAGCVFVNELVRSSPELPFGGTKESGFGRELGVWGLHAFANVKTIVGA